MYKTDWRHSTWDSIVDWSVIIYIDYVNLQGIIGIVGV